ncbi:MAG: hypothetical protein ACK55I_20110 [bacterium]|jgi:lipoate-protein ligase B
MRAATPANMQTMERNINIQRNIFQFIEPAGTSEKQVTTAKESRRSLNTPNVKVYVMERFLRREKGESVD